MWLQTSMKLYPGGQIISNKGAYYKYWYSIVLTNFKENERERKEKRKINKNMLNYNQKQSIEKE